MVALRPGWGSLTAVDGQCFLRETAALIEHGWCCGADARDGVGSAVSASDPAATQWSLLGALAAVSERPGADATALRDALWGIAGVISDASLDSWNDRAGRTQADTLLMLAQAQTSLGRQPPPSTGWSSPGV